MACLLNKYSNIKKDKFSYINKYILNQDDIFEINESENFTFYKEIVKRKMIAKLKNNGQKYIMETKMNIAALKKNIKNSEIKYNVLYPCFKEKNQIEEILKERISIIFGDEDSNQIFDIMKSKVLAIIKILDEFKLIYNYFQLFYPNTFLEDIKIKNLI